MNINNICRACLSTEMDVKSFNSIFNMDFLNIFQSLTNLVITFNDGLSSVICCKCMDKLKEFNEFKIKCIQSNEILLLKRKRLVGLSAAEIKSETYVHKLSIIVRNMKRAHNNIILPNNSNNNINNNYNECNNVESVIKYAKSTSTSIIPLNNPINEQINQFSPKENTEILPNSNQQEATGVNEKLPILNQQEETTNDEKFQNLNQQEQTAANVEILPNSNRQEETTNDEKLSNQIDLQQEKTNNNNENLSNCNQPEETNETINLDQIDETARMDTIKIQKNKKRILMELKKSFPMKRKQIKKKIKIRKQDYPYVCKECETGFLHKEKYDGHLREHAGKKPAVCEYCGGEYTWHYLSKHMEREHKEHIIYKCHCGKTFAYESILIQHKSSVHGNNNSFICETCGKSFYAKFKLDNHSLTHTKETPYVCDQCGKKFKAKYGLKNHLFRHQNIRNHKCNSCGKAFMTDAELRVHLRSHSDVLNFECKVCEKRFRHQQQVTFHMRSHDLLYQNRAK